MYVETQRKEDGARGLAEVDRRLGAAARRSSPGRRAAPVDGPRAHLQPRVAVGPGLERRRRRERLPTVLRAYS